MWSPTLGVLLLTLTAVYAVKDVMKITEAAMPDCMKEFPATEEELGALFGERKVTDTKNLKCLIKCLLNKNGLMKGDSFSVDDMTITAKEVYSSDSSKVEAATNLAKYCYSLATVVDGCEKAAQVIACLLDNNTKYNFDILKFSP